MAKKEIKRQATSDKLKGNKNAEKWNEKDAVEVFDKAVSKASEKFTYTVSGRKIEGYAYHFIGEIASELNLYHELFRYLASKYEKCGELSKVLLNRLESNCFSDSKKGIIKEATAIMNLKSNYKWTDRLDNTSDGEKLTTTIINLGDGEKPKDDE